MPGIRKSYKSRSARKDPLQRLDAYRQIQRSALMAASRAAPMRGVLVAAGEFKSLTVAVNEDVDTGGSVQLLNGCARGDDINQRVGRQILMKSIQVKCNVYGVAGTATDQTVRFLIVYDRQANATALTGAQVLDSFSTTGFKNLENRHRFSILYDRPMVINATSEPGTRRVFDWYRKLNHPVTFNAGDAGDITDISTGSLYLLTVGINVAGNTAAIINGNIRIRYLDN